MFRKLIAVGMTAVVAQVASAQAAVPKAAAPAQAQASYKKDLPAALVKKAKIAEAKAAATAQAKVPTGKIQGVELEEENGKLMYSYDLKIPGKSGTEEVNVDAMTGAVIAVEHEDAAAEKKEADADKKGAKAAPAKKPDSTAAKKKP
jgi:uncharacterized membrane protein YkoI